MTYDGLMMPLDEALGTNGLVHYGSKGVAVFSHDMKRRYALYRRTGNLNDHLIAWVLLNPSTADQDQDDPTIARCLKRSRIWGYSGAIFLNIFAYRSTDPYALHSLGQDEVNRDRAVNDIALREFTADAERIVCGWGVHGDEYNRQAQVLDLLSDRELYCLGRTAGGNPRHPLYLPYSTTLQRFGEGGLD